jgi:hypothetical protein
MEETQIGPLVESLPGEWFKRGDRVCIEPWAREDQHRAECGELLGLRTVEEDCPLMRVRLDSGQEVELWSYLVGPEELEASERERWRERAEAALACDPAEAALGCDPAMRRTRKALDAKIRELMVLEGQEG